MAVRRVGGCRIVEELGRGGMAIVYRGIQETLRRDVAIKELSREAARTEESRTRFFREGIAMASFHHQHIVSVYDLIEQPDGLYMVMELVDGPTLAAVLKEGALPLEVAAIVGRQICLALEHAHFHKVIHRDLKPSNVMFAKSGEVKLMDFGIAVTEDLHRLTMTGLALGTPAYMSPEQVMGLELDGRSDVYALGVVLYECITGLKTFTGNSAGDVFAKITAGKHAGLRKIPRGPMRRIVKRCLRTDPAKRYAQAALVRRDLDHFLAKQVHRSHREVLLNFLHQRRRLSEVELRSALMRTRMAPVTIRRSREFTTGWLVLLTLAAVAAAAATSPYWLPTMLRLAGVPWVP